MCLLRYCMRDCQALAIRPGSASSHALFIAFSSSRRSVSFFTSITSFTKHHQIIIHLLIDRDNIKPLSDSSTQVFHLHITYRGISIDNNTQNKMCLGVVEGKRGWRITLFLFLLFALALWSGLVLAARLRSSSCSSSRGRLVRLGAR